MCELKSKLDQLERLKVINSSLDQLCLSLKNMEIINQLSDEFEICDN